jgi:hypothetical protein
LENLYHGEGTIKTQNPKYRLYWCLIEFIGDTVIHVGIFDPTGELLPLYLLSDLPPSHSKHTEYTDSLWL